QDLLRQLLNAEDYRARAAAVRVLRYTGHQVADQAELLRQAAADDHGRVRMEAIVTASWLEPEKGLPVIEEAGQHPLDDWMIHAHATALAHLNDHAVGEVKEEAIQTHLEGAERELFVKGKAIYAKEGYCATCHQADGKGLVAS